MVLGQNYNSDLNKTLAKGMRGGKKAILKNYTLLYIQLEIIRICIRIFFYILSSKNIFRWSFENNVSHFTINECFLKDF